MIVNDAPPPGALSTSNRPPSRSRRSRRLNRPKRPSVPSHARRTSGSKPTPSSLTTIQARPSGVWLSRTRALATFACLTTLNSSSRTASKTSTRMCSSGGLASWARSSSTDKAYFSCIHPASQFRDGTMPPLASSGGLISRESERESSTLWTSRLCTVSRA